MSTDTFGRSIHYLRISVTDRCNYRCRYCMPEEGVPWKGHDKIMSLEDIAYFVEIASEYGIKHIRLTGGEPLVRPGLADLIKMLKRIDGIEDISLTTNGALLRKHAPALKEAGLDRVNISLDTLDEEAFHYITRRGHVEDAVDGIHAALEYGFNPVKVNCVVVRSLHQKLDQFAKMTIDKPLHVRFIEYMPVGDSAGFDDTGWSKKDTIPNEELIAMISDLTEKAGWGALEPAGDNRPMGWGPAAYYKLPGAKGTIGFISALSNHFCSQCNRLRLTADGGIRPCLFSDLEYPVLEAVKNRDKAAVKAQFENALLKKPENHADRVGTERLMSQIGG